jgi:RHS repeat-associated protein
MNEVTQAMNHERQPLSRKHRGIGVAVGVAATVVVSIFGSFGNAAKASGLAQVQEVGATESAQSTTLAATITSTAGDLLVVTATLRGVSTFGSTAITDSASDTYTTVLTKSTGSNVTGMFYVANAAAVSSVTVHASATATITASVQEFSGVSTSAPLDVDAGASATSTAPASGSTGTTAQAVELVVGGIGWNGGTTISAQTSGYTVNTAHQSTATSAYNNAQSAYEVTTATGTQAYAATISASVFWGDIVATFTATSTGASYTYDQAGRLATVTTSAGSATYNYDAAGNLLSISRTYGGPRRTGARPEVTVPKPRISRLTAYASGSWDLITVVGSGFAASALLDRLRIGNIDADVMSASVNRLVARVPKGSTAGVVNLVTPAGAASVPATPAVIAAFRPSTPVRRELPHIVAPLPLMASKGTTALSGLIEDVNSVPLQGVSVSIGSKLTTTDDRGRFLLTGLVAGHRELWIDATAPTDGVNHGTYEEGVVVTARQTSVVPWTIWLPQLDLTHAITIASPTTSQIVYSSPGIPGLQVVIPKGTVIHDHYGKVVHQLSLTATPLTRTPLPLAPGMPLYYTLQPSDSLISGPGLQINYPNASHARPGTYFQFDDNDPAWLGSGWYAYGIGKVSADGAQIVPPSTLRIHYIHSYSVAPDPNCAAFAGTILGFFCGLVDKAAHAGDPVDLESGLFINTHTDLALPDTLPIAVTRVYRQGDPELRAFGYSQSDNLDMFVSPDAGGNYDVQMPDGADVKFAPSGTSYIYDATGSTSFQGATLDEIADNNLVVTLKNGTQYDFGTFHPSLTGITDEYGNSITVTRDPSTSELEQVTSPDGRWIAFTWGTCITGSSPASCITQATDNTGRSVEYGYDGNGRLTSVEDPATKTTLYGWGTCTGGGLACTQIATIEDPTLDTWLQTTYDANGRVHVQTDADSGTYQFSYTLSGTSVTEADVIDPNTNTSRSTFDSSGYVSAITDASGTAVQETTAYTRDAATQQVTDAIDQLGRDAHFTYDTNGNVLTVTMMYGTGYAETTTFTYEPVFNRVASVKDPLLNLTTYTYQDTGASGVITVTDPVGNQSFTTTQNGEPTSVTDPLGNVTYYSYLNGDLVAVADPDGNVSTQYVDSGGRVLQSTDPDGNTSLYTVDVMNQVTAVQDAAGDTTNYSYNPNGDITSVKDPDTHLTTFTPNNMDRTGTVSDPLTNMTSYLYDGLGNLTQVTDGNGAVDKFTYDAMGRLSTARYGVTGLTTQQSKVTDTYDLGNRLTGIVDTNSGTYTLGYDGFDRLTSESGPEGSVTYTYTLDGQRHTMAPSGGSTVTYGYDANGALNGESTTSQAVTILPDADQRPTSITLPDGIVETYGYDAASQVNSITDTSSSTTVGTLTYGYSGDGQRTTVGGTLAQVALPAATTATSTFNGDNELTALNGAALTYDNDGNLKTDATNTYSWDDRGQLSGISGGTTAAYSYDPFGVRQSSTVSGTTTNYLTDGGNVLENLIGGTVTASDLTGPSLDQTFSRTDSTGTSSLLTDSLGTTVGLGSSAGAVATNYSYEPYGAATSGGTSSANPLKFVGQQGDGTGLNYDQARYYSPSESRFISQDPLGFGGGSSDLYSYSASDPVNHTDPTGQQGPGGCAVGVAISVVQDFATVLSGRKITAGDVFGGAAVACAEGFVAAEFFAWAGPAFEFFLGPAGDASLDWGADAPDFIVHPNGNVVAVPDGATGPFPADNGAGIKFTGGAGGSGLAPSVSGVRFMDPTAQNPGGYYSYFNGTNQTVDPYSGTPLRPSDPGWHRQW